MNQKNFPRTRREMNRDLVDIDGMVAALLTLSIQLFSLHCLNRQAAILNHLAFRRNK